MQIEPTPLADCLILTPHRHVDVRGWFAESWNAARMAEAGLDLAFVQDNTSFSPVRGTLRGLHYQCPPRAQTKLVRCTRGAILDVAVDIRTGSPSQGRWFSVRLSSDNGRQLLVPKGFLHGFLTLTDDAVVQYKCTDFYSPQHEVVVRWNDPALEIDWGITAPLLSEKDARAPLLADIGPTCDWTGA